MSGVTRGVAADGFDIGLIYEDCAFHPVLCTYVSYEEDELQGISLIDASTPRSCSLQHCGPVPLTVTDAAWIKEHFSRYTEARAAGSEPHEIIG